MTDPTRQMLRDLGVPDEAIRVESFTSPSRAAASHRRHPRRTSRCNCDAGGRGRRCGRGHGDVRPLGEVRPVPAGQTVLEAAEALGVSINYDCRAGICGQCKTKLLAGRVIMDAEDALDAMDRANNVILSCQARCVDQVVVEA